MENKTTQVEGYCFISKDQIGLIQEIKDLCFFSHLPKRKWFLKAVANSAGAETLDKVQSQDFGTAYLTALGILHEVGANVFKPQRERETESFIDRMENGTYKPRSIRF